MREGSAGAHRAPHDEPTRRHLNGYRHDADRVDAYPCHDEAHRTTERAAGAVRKSREVARRIVAPDGTLWLVYQLESRADREGASLVFESESVVRRLRVFPADWRALSDSALADLCQDR